MKIFRSYKLELWEIERNVFQVLEIEHDEFETLDFDNKTLNNLLRCVLFDLVAGCKLLNVFI